MAKYYKVTYYDFNGDIDWRFDNLEEAREFFEESKRGLAEEFSTEYITSNRTNRRTKAYDLCEWDDEGGIVIDHCKYSFEDYQRDEENDD